MAETDIAGDVLIVGGGPTGIAAAVAASGNGQRVILADENHTPGGQIWRGETTAASSAGAALWLQKLEQANVLFVHGARVAAHPQAGLLLAETSDGIRHLHYRRLILATGARELFLPFPGWTRPNVMGAGGLQALAKNGWPVAGRRVVVAGTGPLLLVVAAYLKKCGAQVICLAEQAGRKNVWRLGASLWREPAKLRQAISLRRDLRGVEMLYGTWPVAVAGTTQLEAVTLRQGTHLRQVTCDYLACGWHLMPNTELAQLLGCAVRGGVVVTDDWQETTQTGVYSAGESTGVGGVELSLIEGQIAGYAAIEHHDMARRLFAERARMRVWARRLNKTFALRDEVKNLAAPATLVCRCEDVSHARLRQCNSWREAKLYTRCGMGPCQGRICGPATEVIYGWHKESTRPPVLPVRVDSLI